MFIPCEVIESATNDFGGGAKGSLAPYPHQGSSTCENRKIDSPSALQLEEDASNQQGLCQR
jgi:hypothetical protein